MISMNIDVLLRQMKLNMLIFLLPDSNWIKGNNCLLLDLSNIYNVGMDSDVHESIVSDLIW